MCCSPARRPRRPSSCAPCSAPIRPGSPRSTPGPTAAVSLTVAKLALSFPSPDGRGDQGVRTALVAGLIFAVHPLHVEAVANVIGLGELMAAAGVCLAVYAAVIRQNVFWSGVALLLGLLSKENAIVAPALIIWAW